MGKLSGKNVGLRDKKSNKIISVYPGLINGSDETVKKTVKDWYYMQSCGAEDDLLTSFVDIVTDTDIKNQTIK